MEFCEGTSFEDDDDIQLLGFVLKFGDAIRPIKREPEDNGYENVAQGIDCSTDHLPGTTQPASNPNFYEYPGDNCQNSDISSTVKLETDPYEAAEIPNHDNFRDLSRSNSHTLVPNSYNAITQSTLPTPYNFNQTLKKVPNVTVFQRNSQRNVYSMGLDHLGRRSTQQENTFIPDNTYSIKKKRGRPPGIKNKKSRKNYRANFETMLPYNQSFDTSERNFPPHYQSYSANGVFNSVGSTSGVKPKRTYKKRMPKSRNGMSTAKQNKNLSSNVNMIPEQRTNYACSSNVNSDSLVIPSLPTMPDYPVSNPIHGKTREEDITTTIPNCSPANHTSNNPISKDLNQSIDNTRTLPTLTHETSVSSNVSEVNLLEPIQSETRNLFGIMSSDEDEGPATVYQIKTNGQSNALYNSNVLKECLIGKSNPGEKSLQISEENFNPENKTFSLDTDEFPSGYNIRSSPVSPSFQNVVSNVIQKETNPQFPEKELEFPTNFHSESVPEDIMKVSNGMIYPNNHDWRNFSYLVYNPNNKDFYAFDPKNPTVVNTYRNENLINMLLPYLDEYKFIQLEIRGHNQFGHMKNTQTSNNKRFECDNYTISYEPIPTENAKKILHFLKYSRDDPYACVPTISGGDNFQTEEVEACRTVCFWNTSLYRGMLPIEEGVGPVEKETPNIFQTVHRELEETISIPCCRLLGLSNLSFEEVICYVRNNETLKDLFEKETESYNDKNQSLQEHPTETNIDNSTGVENNQSCDFNLVKVKEEPFDDFTVSSNVPENFLDESLNHTNTNPTENINDDDIIFLESLPRYNNAPPIVSSYPLQVKNDLCSANSLQQYHADAEQFPSIENQQNFYNAAIPEKNVCENTKSLSYYNNALLSSRNCKEYMNNSDMGYFNNRRCSNSYENNTLQENFNSLRYQQLNNQGAINYSTNNQFPFGNTCPPALPFSSNQLSVSRYINPNSEFSQIQEFNHGPRFTNNSTETAVSTYAGNYTHHEYIAYNPLLTTFRSTSLHYSGPPPNQIIGEASRYQRLNNIDIANPNTFGRNHKRVEVYPSFRNYSGGTIINLSNNGYQNPSLPSQTDSSNAISANHCSYQNLVGSHYQYSNASTNEEHLPVHKTYPITIKKEPPCDYEPSGYNGFKNVPQNAAVEALLSLQMPMYNETSSHNPTSGVTRPNYQNDEHKITNENSYRENSICNQNILLEAEETHHEILNVDSNHISNQDGACEMSPLQLLEDISTREPNAPHNYTKQVKTKSDNLAKNYNASSKNSTMKHRASEKSFVASSLVGKDYKKVLEEWYQKDTKPNADTRHKLAKKIGQTEVKVNTWFKNRRQAEKRKLNETLHVNTQARQRLKLTPDISECELSRSSEPSMPILPPSL